MMRSSSLNALSETSNNDKILLLAAPCTPGSVLPNDHFKEKPSFRVKLPVHAHQNTGLETALEKQPRITSASENPIAAIDKQQLTLRPTSEPRDSFLQDTVQIFNKSSCEIAFKVMTTTVVNRRQFGVQPAAGTVKPGETESVLFTMQLKTDIRAPGPNEVKFRILTAPRSLESRKLSKTFWSSAKKSQSIWSFDLATAVAEITQIENLRASGTSVLTSDYARTVGEWQEPEGRHERAGFRSAIFRKKPTPVEKSNANDDLLFRYEQSLSTSETQQQATVFSNDSPVDTSNLLTSEVTAQGTLALSDVMPTDPYSLLADEMKVNRLMDQVKTLEKCVESQNLEISHLKEQVGSGQIRKSDPDVKSKFFSAKIRKFLSRCCN